MKETTSLPHPTAGVGDDEDLTGGDEEEQQEVNREEVNREEINREEVNREEVVREGSVGSEESAESVEQQIELERKVGGEIASEEGRTPLSESRRQHERREGKEEEVSCAAARKSFTN